ncbi:MAG: two-component regulator propeller domain-containing protein [Saprospiraceae bacterium]
MVLKSEMYLLILISLLAFTSCNGQSNKKDPSKEPLGQVVEKLDDDIWTIYQDKKDHYWFGSNTNGVYRYDGKTLVLFSTPDGLIDNSIRGIKEDTAGNLFFETPSDIYKYDGKTIQSLTPIFSPNNQWKSESNDLWFNCIGNNLYRYDGENLFELRLPEQDLKKAFGYEVTGVPFQNMNNSPYAVYGIDKDKAGNLWFGTVTAGVFRYDGKSFLWIAEQELSTLPDGRVPGVRSILEDKTGHFWLSNFISKYKIIDNDSIVTYEKFQRFDPSNQIFNGRLAYFNSGLVDVDGNLWMTTYGGGVWFYDGVSLQNFPVKKGEDDVLLISIYEDNTGVLWLGTHNGGVYRFNGKKFHKFDIN